MDDDLLPIGTFARLAGLSTHALRHYHAVDLLLPVEVDEATGYRRYSRSQLVTARLINDLRWLSVPIQQVRTIVADPESAEARALLSTHAGRLSRDRGHLDRRISQLTDYATSGVTVPTIPTSTVPVQIKVGVANIDRARRLYDEAFGLAESVIRHADDDDVTGYQFGRYGQPGRSTFGLTVIDLDDAHRRVLDAGAVEAVGINAPHGMPRNSAVTDPDGNWIRLHQG